MAERIRCQCSCGEVVVELKAQSLVRLLCHCTICQAVHQRAYSDDIILLSSDVFINKPSAVIYKSNTKVFPLKRGECEQCKSPIISFSSVMPFLTLAVIPVYYLAPQTPLPQPSAHVFYHRAVNQMNDNLPKYNGYFVSQLMTMKCILYNLVKLQFNKLIN